MRQQRRQRVRQRRRVHHQRRQAALGWPALAFRHGDWALLRWVGDDPRLVQAWTVEQGFEMLDVLLLLQRIRHDPTHPLADIWTRLQYHLPPYPNQEHKT